ncbi:sigma-70 family RNA polymerase sigma factor [Tibeticola sp.]|jgi:RNA polymerase sigma-70 factor (ECF subfamily)|uniref:sigma-70 family RNA polymerase sigma factor n=1 Tax=Tibeticola sp. TaxID=2005368 RepID=UPI002587908D|nr:sigma-70 family RNA polymerase sigma factor [Tibeticola sp.]MCI4441053.1 sigma-70 family RNA polymerase sigma factor [Tibeticola sp.]
MRSASCGDGALAADRFDALDDAQLVAQARTELPYRTGAYEALMHRHGSRIRALARRFASTPEEAEDLAQDAMLKVFFELPRFRGDSAFTTWLWRLTANACIDQQRRAAAHANTHSLDGGDAVEHLVDPVDGIAATEARIDSERLLAALAPEDRLLVLLRLLVGLEFQEIAEVMNLGLSAAKMRYTRAIERLRALATSGSASDHKP